MKDTAKPNETTEKLEQIRRQSLKDAYSKKKPEEKEDSGEEIQEKAKKDEKKLDNDQKNDYIEEGKSEDPDSKYAELYEKQFKGDPVKAVKSWSETQREYMKLKNSVKEKDEYFTKISAMIEKNPLLAEVIEKAENQEDIESFLASKFSESDEDKPVKQSKSKPNITDDINEVDEKTLIESGYLDANEKQFSNADDWDSKLRQASLRYLYNELPNQIAEKSAKKYKEQIERLEQDRLKTKRQQENEKLMETRYLNGIQTVSEQFGLDFVNNDEHKALLDEIEARTAGIRDINNPSVIDQDAVEMATEYVLKRKGLLNDLKQEQPQRKESELFEKNKFNANVRDRNRGDKPVTVADKLKQRHLQNYERQVLRRTNTKT